MGISHSRFSKQRRDKRVSDGKKFPAEAVRRMLDIYLGTSIVLGVTPVLSERDPFPMMFC